MTDSTSIYRNYYPNKQEFRVVGIVGILIYSIISILACWLLYYRVKNNTSKHFFYCVIIMSICEMPRYYDIAITETYANTIAYGVHMAAAPFCFISFSIVAYQWSGLLELGSYSRAIYSKQALLIVIILFGVNDILAIIFCTTSPSLRTYFLSQSYEIYVLLEAARNLIYSAFLSYYGVRLIRRFWHFSQIDIRNKDYKANDHHHCCGCAQWFCDSLNNKEQSSMFITAVVRLTSVLLIATACFTLRIVMLTLKVIALHISSFHITSQYFPLFGLCWFTLTDFIPRAIPTLAFMLLMQTNRGKVNKQENDKREEDRQIHVSMPHQRSFDESKLGDHTAITCEVDVDRRMDNWIYKSFQKFYQPQQPSKKQHSVDRQPVKSISREYDHPTRDTFIGDDNQDKNLEDNDSEESSDGLDTDTVNFTHPYHERSNIWRIISVGTGTNSNSHVRTEQDSYLMSDSSCSYNFSQSVNASEGRVSLLDRFNGLIAALSRPTSNDNLKQLYSDSSASSQGNSEGALKDPLLSIHHDDTALV